MPDKIRTNMKNLLNEVHLETIRQYERFGEQNHKPSDYYAILAEEVGEVAKEVVEFNITQNVEHLMKMRRELIQSAGVAVSMISCLDRQIHELL